MIIRASSLNIGAQCALAPSLYAEHSDLDRPELIKGRLAHQYLELRCMNREDEANKLLVRKGENELFLQLSHFWDANDLQRRICKFEGDKYIEQELMVRQNYSEWEESGKVYNYHGDYELLGHADLILHDKENRVAVVIDWKTGPGQRFVLPPIENDMQMKAYAFMTYNMLNVTCIKIVRFCTDSNHFDTGIYDLYQLRGVEEELEALCKKILHKTPSPGISCSHCLVKDKCHVLAEQVTALVPQLENYNVPEVITDAQAKAVLLYGDKVKKAIDILKDSAKRGVELGYLTLEHDGKTAQIVEGTRKVIKDEEKALVKFVELAKKRSKEALTFNKTKARKILKELEEDYDEMLEGNTKEVSFKRLVWR